MEMREVRSFVTLASQLHFGRAASLLNLSQPALTKQIARLEEAVGGALFTRGRHGTQLTSLGQQFLRGSRSLLRDFDELLDQAQRAARGETGRLRIGFGFHTFELVPRIIVRLRKSIPSIEISLRDMSTAEQVEALRAEKLDLGFVRLPVPSEFETRPAIEDRVMLVSSTLAKLPVELTLADCRDRPFVLISQDRAPTFHRHVLTLFSKHGFHPHVVQEVPEVTTALALVRAGLGLTMIPQSFGTSRFAGVRFHLLKDREARWRVGAAWRKGDDNPLIERFLTLLNPEVK
ncbi:MAG: LysR family transcriptional regulator [Chthoniobacteraceae bacterium]|nr:LysR family transcriptional regulator [Chthoniobacteraceae bacterium]